MTEHPPRRTELRDPTTRDAGGRVHERLLDLAEEASYYLRRHREPSVRVAAALLLASSLAACSPSAPTAPDEPEVAPLAQEVKEGLPSTPGRYSVDPTSLARDEQGVYSLAWRDAASGAQGAWAPARASLMQLAEGPDDALDVPASGDPVLYLRPDTAITLPGTAEETTDAASEPTPGAAAGPTPTPGGSTRTSSSYYGTHRSGVAWYPFPVGGNTTVVTAGNTIPSTTPAYRNPPAYTGDVGQGVVRGASSSSVAPSTTARTWSSRSGQAGGTGSGSAVSGRSGTLDGPASGAARPSSAGFSGGRSGASSSGG